ncbi:unnamed protein product [Enterobius vermicularis]|uniref:MFS domain-containing protein n=1 Tax=Enterobius vermicularis TaxID=51028 RepID=A0A0N4V086_ENTVE|nr:unnamed protein product [Enterobius vermicularis]
MNIWFIGFFFGIWLSPLLNDRYGRKIGFIVGNAFSLLASILRFLAIILKVPELLFVGRAIASVMAAVTYQSLILFLQECSPTDLRGMLSLMSEISYSSMCALGMFLGTNQIFGHKLSFLLGFAIIPSEFTLVVLFPIPDTPKYLYITKRDREAAIKSITFFQGRDANVEEEDLKSTSSLKEILTTPYIRKAICLSFLALENTVPLWSLLLSSTEFLRHVNLEDNVAAWTSTGMTILYIVGTVIGFFAVERFKRRILLIGLSSLNNTILLLYVVFELLNKAVDGIKYGCMACLLLYGLTYGCGVGSLSWILSLELVPQRHRSLVQSLCYSLNTVMVVISTFVILPLYEKINSFAFLVLYIAPSTYSIFYMIRFLPETSKREVFDIVEDLKGRRVGKIVEEVSIDSSEMY